MTNPKGTLFLGLFSAEEEPGGVGKTQTSAHHVNFKQPEKLRVKKYHFITFVMK